MNSGSNSEKSIVFYQKALDILNTAAEEAKQKNDTESLKSIEDSIEEVKERV